MEVKLLFVIKWSLRGFENLVSLNGSKTVNLLGSTGLGFENLVSLNGSKTLWFDGEEEDVFENLVSLNGSKTDTNTR